MRRITKRAIRKHQEYLNGKRAYIGGKSKDECPFPIKSVLGISWRAGWLRQEHLATLAQQFPSPALAENEKKGETK